MQLTSSQLKTNHKALIDALKRGETVEITYHGQILGVVYPTQNSAVKQEQENAMNAFFGIHRDLGTESVEEEMREVRAGRRKRLNDF